MSLTKVERRLQLLKQASMNLQELPFRDLIYKFPEQTINPVTWGVVLGYQNGSRLRDTAGNADAQARRRGPRRERTKVPHRAE
jgi:hypothetical protein